MVTLVYCKIFAVRSSGEKPVPSDHSGMNKSMDPTLLEDKSEVDKSETDTYEAAIGEDIYGYEFNLHTSQIGKTCPKHPGHKDFIPIKEFTIDHLPQDCPLKEKYFDCLKPLADLVVHITALNVSIKRPENFPLFRHRGGCVIRDGSGFVKDAYLCGQSGQGFEVIADMLEKCLDVCELSELDAETFDSSHHSLFYSEPINPFKTYLRHCITCWLTDNVQNFAHDQCRGNVTRDLMHQIKSSKDGQNLNRTDGVTEDCARSSTTLNDFRKSRGLSVSDFCMALSRGLSKSNDDVKRFWETFGPLIDKPCPCSECHQSGNPKKTWWLTVVRTAAHILFDSKEAEGAIVSVFYDDDVSGRKTMRCINCTDAYLSNVSERVKGDGSNFLCSLHDYDAGERLKSSIESCFLLKKKLPFSLKEKSKHLTTAVIAHPHGSTKHITVGTGWWPVYNTRDEESGKRQHTAPTCPGSSGGAVLRLSDYVQPHSEAVTTQLSKCCYPSGTPFWSPI